MITKGHNLYHLAIMLAEYSSFDIVETWLLTEYQNCVKAASSTKEIKDLLAIKINNKFGFGMKDANEIIGLSL